MSRYHDDSTRASDPVHIGLSVKKLRKLKVPRNVDMLPSDLLNEHLGFGDSRAAVVVSTDPLLVAAYTDEFDCVILLRFQPSLVAEYGLEVGSRLLTVNTYQRNPPLAADIVPGPNALDQWFNFFPLIAEFLTDDLPQVEARKAAISEGEWARTREQGERALQARTQPIREGHPYASNDPLHKPAPQPQRVAPLHHNQGPSMPSVDDWKRSVRQRQNTPSGEGWDVGPLGGLAMMLVAAVWFFSGLNFGKLYFFPPILFVVGIVTVLRGVFRED